MITHTHTIEEGTAVPANYRILTLETGHISVTEEALTPEALQTGRQCLHAV